MLELKNITKVYNSGRNATVALSNVSVNFGSRGLIVVLGKSGCGKSTMLNIIGGLDQPTSGEVIVNGRSNKTFSKNDYDSYRNTYVGIVFQEFNLIDDITVFENIDMTLKLQEKSADVNTVDEALALVGLSNLGYRKPNELSGGQRQRVALARALLKKPEIILADEPTGSLDSNTSEEVFDSLKKIAETKLVIVVSHDRELANNYGDRIIEIVDGCIVSDVEREHDEAKQLKSLSKDVVEVSTSGKLNKELINSRLVKDKVNFLGLSHDKDRIALAYPETVDMFYKRADEVRRTPTKPENIPVDHKPFQLSKGRLPIKDAIKMARGSIKRRKKRYRFLTALTTFCFAFMAIAVMIGMLSVTNIVAQTAFQANSQPLVGIGKVETEGDNKFSVTTSIDNLPEVTAIMGDNYAKYYDFRMTPIWAAKETDNYDYGGWINYQNTGFALSYLNGVLECKNIESLGLSLIPDGGTGECKAQNELVISDMAAWELTRSGFIGRNKAGEFGIHYPEELRDTVGCEIKMRQTGFYYKIVGVFKTDYENYRSVINASELDSNARKLNEKLTENNLFLYMKAFAMEGFSTIFKANSNDTGSSYYDITLTAGGGSSYGFGAGSMTGMIYDKKNLERVDSNKPYFAWTKPGIQLDSDGCPVTIGEKEIILGALDAAYFAGLYNVNDLKDIFTNPVFISKMNETLSLRVRKDNKILYPNTGGFTVAAVFEPDNIYNSSIKLSPLMRETLAGSSDEFDALFFNRGAFAASLQGNLGSLHTKGYYGFTASASLEGMLFIENVLAMVGQVFMYVSLVFALFAFLMIFNYISASVRFRTKEIAVYRVVGAKASDVSKIFLAEGGFITARTTVGATILALIIVWIFNLAIGDTLLYMGIRFALLAVSPLHVLGIAVVSALFVLISSILPITNITRKKPIDAVKMI